MKVIGNPDIDFIKQNPQFATLRAYKSVYEKNDKKIASKICWSVYFYTEIDDKDNLYGSLPLNDRIKEIQSNYYEEFDPKKYEDLINTYSNYSFSLEKKLYSIHLTKFDELTMIVNNLDMSNDDDLEKYLNIMAKFGKIQENLDKAKKKLEESAKKSNATFGGVKLSVAERRRNRKTSSKK